MIRGVFLCCLAVASIGFAAEGSMRPEAFAHQAPIQLSGPGPFHRLVLPLAVYEGASRPDLGDLRVLNAAGEVLPHAWRPGESPNNLVREEIKVPFFPLASVSGGGSDLEVNVRQQGDGTLVEVRRSAAPASTAPGKASHRGLIIDGSRLSGAQALHLKASGGGQAVQAYTLETSDDLQHWRPLKANAVYVHLAHGERSLVSDGAEWGTPAGPYLRLLWREPDGVPQVEEVSLTRQRQESTPPALLWSAPILPIQVGEAGLDYRMPTNLPLEQLRIGLPQVNLLFPYTLQGERCAVLSSRHGHLRREECYWETLASGVAYRLRIGDGEARSPDQAIHGVAASGRLRLRVDARASLGDVQPSLQIGFVPRELVFLARGPAPYTLAWGGTGLPADLPLATLMPGQQTDRLPAADQASLLADERPAANGTRIAPPPPKPAPQATGQARWILWTVLAVGLAVLGLMARSLLAQLKRPPD